MELKREGTIYDLALGIGASTSTVSGALNDHPAISNKTKKRVLELANSMGYRRNSFARNLRQEKSLTIGVIVHELKSHFIISVLSGIEQVLANAGYNVIIAHSEEKMAREVFNASNLFHKRIDGLIASLAHDTNDLNHYEPFFQREIPVVFFDRVKEDGFGIKVVIDNQNAAYDITTHLIEQGCKNILHITGNLTQNVYADRLKGFQKALSEHRIICKSERVIVNDLSEKAGLEVAERILELKNKPDAIFVTNDLCAAVCMPRLKADGIHIPEQIAIAGFNDDIISSVVEPQLTTIQYNGEEMGRVAATILLEQLNKDLDKSSNYTAILPHKLILRNSSRRKCL